MLSLRNRGFSFALTALILVSTALVQVPSATTSMTPGEIDALHAVAIASLRDTYEVLMTGTPARPLVSSTNEFGVAHTPLGRVEDVLRRRKINADYGLTFTEASVKLLNPSVTVVGTEIRLHALEEIALAFRSTQYTADPTRDVTISRIGHTFVFAGPQKTLIRDDYDLVPVNRSNEPRPASPMYPTADVQPPSPRTQGRVGRLAAPLNAGYYDRTAAYAYAQQYAVNPNPAYRDYSGGGAGGDCTNFVSQVMRAGGWVDKPGWYQDWNAWWYNSQNQTRTWTYTNAFQYFFANSGRGQFLSYLVDLSIGDVMQIEFTGDSEIDHGMVVQDRYCSCTTGIFLSYHTNNTYRKPLSDVLAIYPIPPSLYWAEHVIGTTP